MAPAFSLGQCVQVGKSSGDALSKGETEILIDGLSDDVSFSWALIHLGIRANPPVEDVPPSTESIAIAFESFERLVSAGLAKLGRVEYADRTQTTGSLAPVTHVAEPIEIVRERVERACREASDQSDWAFCCWLVNTGSGDAVARVALAQEGSPPIGTPPGDV